MDIRSVLYVAAVVGCLCLFLLCVTAEKLLDELREFRRDVEMKCDGTRREIESIGRDVDRLRARLAPRDD